MEQDNSNNNPVQVQEGAPVDPLANIDVNAIDFNNPDTIPEALKNATVYLPPKHIIYSLMSNYKKRLSNPFGRSVSSNVSKSWFNGALITTEEYSKLSAEETFAYRNKFTKAKKK
jgi:hypothetical protein